jgi:DNA-directed RNA polymerase specialized sigma24 family protein
MTDDPPLTARYVALVTRLRQPMLAWCARQCPQDAEDVYQTAVLAAWEGWPPRHLDAAEAWLWSYMYHKALHARRWHARRRRDAHLLRHLPEYTPRQQPMSRPLEIREAFAAVAPSAREMVLRYAMGESVQTLAMQEGRTVKAEQNHLSRARRVLAR